MTDATPRTVYLDHAATTPMLAEAVEAMTAQLTRTGNASSLHGSGRAARRTVEESRERYDRAYAQAVCAAVASHEQLKQQRSDGRYRRRVHQRASDLYDEVGGWQKS